LTTIAKMLRPQYAWDGTMIAAVSFCMLLNEHLSFSLFILLLSFFSVEFFSLFYFYFKIFLKYF
jgi:hypothetical protein